MDLGSLCIEAGRAVWVLYIDILILSNGGNLLDVCVMALNGALDEGMSDFRLYHLIEQVAYALFLQFAFHQ